MTILDNFIFPLSLTLVSSYNESRYTNLRKLHFRDICLDQSIDFYRSIDRFEDFCQVIIYGSS